MSELLTLEQLRAMALNRPPYNTAQAVDLNLDYALYYVFTLDGLRVFPTHCSPAPGRCSCGNPTCKSIGKHPLTLRGLKDASRDPRQIRSWWKKWPYANISGTPELANVIAWVDVDPAKGGFESWSKLVSRLGIGAQVENTIISATGGRGNHIWFRPSRVLRNSASQVAPGVDIRCHGGYVILPPSSHKSGRPYRFLPGHSPADLAIAPMPARLEAFIVAATETKASSATSSSSPTTHATSRDTEVMAALQFISFDDRDCWLKVGMGLHHHFGAAGRAIWDSWSMRSTKYHAKTQNYTWKKFKPGGNGTGTVTLGSLFHLARAAGWRPTVEAKK